MNFMERFTDLKKRERAFEKEIWDLGLTIYRDDWRFGLHVHYDEPRVSVWKSGNDYNLGDSAEVMIKDGCAQLYDAGMYWEDWQRHEIESILDEWLSGEVGVNFMERFTDLKKQEQEIRNELESLGTQNHVFEYDDWRFCLHTHYPYNLRVSAWKVGSDKNNTAKFIINDDNVRLHSAGRYWEEWHEIKSILDEWLLKGVIIEG